MEGVSQQFEAVKKGFEMVFPLSNLKLFYPEEVMSRQSVWPVRQLHENWIFYYDICSRQYLIHAYVAQYAYHPSTEHRKTALDDTFRFKRLNYPFKT